jgi:predicted O-methyltransferase YrrM
MNTLDYITEKYQTARTGKVEIPGVDRLDLASLFSELGFRTGVEVGTERGVYAKALCNRIRGLKLSCVDGWAAYKGYREHVSQAKLDSFYAETAERLSPYDVTLVRKFSVEAAKGFADGSLDFVYLDANHDYGHVVADLCAWTPKVKKGGIVAGHDYIRRSNPEYPIGVVEAVDGYVSAHRIDPLFILGRKERREGEKRDDARSWMFVVL